MIAAIGSILGEGTFAGFAFSDETVTMETYDDGSVFDEGDSPGESLIEGPIYELREPDAAVAVLIGPVTGSAAEYTGIAFIGREQTSIFGEPSADLTTGISGYLMMDGAAVGLATSAMVDRTGTAYPDGIDPDTVVEFETASIMDPTDPVATAATAWLLQQPACSK
jgi:C-terminal processing protease CtpA/Prc